MRLYFEDQHIGQIFRRIDSGEPFAIIGSMDKDTERSRIDELETLVSKLAIDKGVTYQYTTGRYTMKNGEIVDEPGYILYHISKEDALDCANKIHQEAIIWNDKNFFGFLYLDGTKEPFSRRKFDFDADNLRHYGTKLNDKQGVRVKREKEYFPTASEISSEKDIRKRPFAFSESFDICYNGTPFIRINNTKIN